MEPLIHALPAARPGAVAAGILAFLVAWNDFFFSLIITLIAVNLMGARQKLWQRMRQHEASDQDRRRMALQREKAFEGSPTSKSSLASIQDAFNFWVGDGGKSLTRVSRVLAFTVG